MPRRGSGAKAALVVLATGTDRTGGAATGLPGNAACNVGFTAGCGTIEHLSTAEFQSRIESEMRKWERDHDKNLVDQLFNGPESARTVLGVDDTLFRLQEGLVRGAVAINHLEGGVRQCVKCGWIDRTPDSTCPVCGSARLLAYLRAVLPPLARRYKVPLEVIAQDVADRLSKAGGIGAWLK